jgi:predicted lactoylglutathione lyase
MIGYTTVGTNNLERAVAFYDELLAELGAGRFMQSDRLVAWAVTPDKPAFSVCTPWDGKQATVGNGTMIALLADSAEKVDAVYAKAMQLGAADEGPPGARMDGFYAAYFRDPDGNKLNIFHMHDANA